MLEGVLRNGTTRNKEMKDDGIDIHSPKEADLTIKIYSEGLMREM